MSFNVYRQSTIMESAVCPLDAVLACRMFLLAVGLALCSTTICRNVAAQAPQTTATPISTAPLMDSEDSRYRIGPGDVLEVKVAKAPELSLEAIRVDQHGAIRMPMLDDDIKAGCLTETELSEKITTLYREYKRNPHVEVFVKEFHSQSVGVIGAVNVNTLHPEGMQFQLRRRIRLLELLTVAGGLSERAGQTVNVVHAGGPSLCEETNNSPTVQGDLGALVTYRLSDTLRAVPEANPVLRPGDVVVVPEGEQIYVVGNVTRPSTIPLKEPLTVSRAIAMAGGTAPNTKKARVRVIRQLPGGLGKQEIYVDLAAIEKSKTNDIALVPNDIVDVPVSGTKSFLKSLTGAVAPAVSQASVRIIP